MSIRNTTRISTYHPIRGAHPAYMIDHINALMAPISLWPLMEDSGTRKDMRAENHLTDNNTVTGNPGPSVNIPLASQFTAANSEYLSLANNAFIDSATGTFSHWGFFYIDTLASVRVKNLGLAFKGAVDSVEWVLWQWQGDDRIRFAVTTDGVWSTRTDAVGPVLSASTWYFIRWGWDNEANTTNIQVDRGAVASATFTGNIFDNNEVLSWGRSPDTLDYIGARMAGQGRANRAITSQEHTWLYNGGSGRSASHLGWAA